MDIAMFVHSYLSVHVHFTFTPQQQTISCDSETMPGFFGSLFGRRKKVADEPAAKHMAPEWRIQDISVYGRDLTSPVLYYGFFSSNNIPESLTGRYLIVLGTFPAPVRQSVIQDSGYTFYFKNTI
jgi:hypothetical protein